MRKRKEGERGEGERVKWRERRKVRREGRNRGTTSHSDPTTHTLHKSNSITLTNGSKIG